MLECVKNPEVQGFNTGVDPSVGFLKSKKMGLGDTFWKDPKFDFGLS